MRSIKSDDDYFVFKNINCLDMGVLVSKLPPISNSQKEHESVVSGIYGEVKKFKGYKNTTKNLECYFMNSEKLSDIYKIMDWLSNNGDLVLSNEPDFYYKARVSNIINLEEYINNDVYSFPLTFEVMPFSYFLSGKRNIRLDFNQKNGLKLFNIGNYFAEPIIKIKGNGEININVNKYSFKLDMREVKCATICSTWNNEIVFDENNENVGEIMEGDFPLLDVGVSEITYSGDVKSIECVPNWRRE